LVKKELREKAERIARRILNRKENRPKADTDERRAKRKRHERLAQMLEKKQRAEDNFERKLRLAVEYTKEMRDAAYRYNRLTGRIELKFVGDRPVRDGRGRKLWRGGEHRTIVSDAPALAKPKSVPDPDTIGAPCITPSGNWGQTRVGPPDYELRFLRGWDYTRTVAANPADEIKRLSADYRAMIAGRPYGPQNPDTKVERLMAEHAKRKLADELRNLDEAIHGYGADDRRIEGVGVVPSRPAATARETEEAA
jgi:hypothetical protein